MLSELFRALVIVPIYVVPLALVVWVIFQFAVEKAPVKALVGLAGGGALCFAAFLMFLSNVYCESCAGRPVSAREAAAVLAYVAFGVLMLAALWFTARPRKRRTPGSDEK